jgi:hypothetical protein
MATKITKSELKTMIREALREELMTSMPRLKESSSGFSDTILTDTLNKALKTGANVAIDTQPGKGTIAAIKHWAKYNGLKTYMIGANSEEIKYVDELGDTFGLDANTVLIIDEYDRIAPENRAYILSNVIEGGQLFAIACYNSANRNSISSAEMRQFEYLIRV